MDPQELVPLEAGTLEGYRPHHRKSIHQTNRSRSCYRAPLKVCRLLAFLIMLPSLLIVVPLYMRYRVYLSQMYPMGMTDMRLIDGKISPTWCQRQIVKSNSTFNAYVVPGTPEYSNELVPVSMTRQLELEDDMKEYWGFYLLKGSIVTISPCVSWPGASLIMIKGYKHLQECAYIGDDSSEELDELLEAQKLGLIPDDILAEKIVKLKEKADGKANDPGTMRRHKAGVSFHDPIHKNNDTKSAKDDSLPDELLDITDHDPEELRAILNHLHDIQQAAKDKAAKYYKPPEHLMSLPALHRHRDTNVDKDERQWLSFKDIDGNSTEEDFEDLDLNMITRKAQKSLLTILTTDTTKTEEKTNSDSIKEGENNINSIKEEENNKDSIKKGENNINSIKEEENNKDSIKEEENNINSVKQEQKNSTSIKEVEQNGNSIEKDSSLEIEVKIKGKKGPKEEKKIAQVTKEEENNRPIFKDSYMNVNRSIEVKNKTEDLGLVEENSEENNKLSSVEIFEDVLQKLQSLGDRGKRVLLRLHNSMGLNNKTEDDFVTRKNEIISKLEGSDDELDRLRKVLVEAIDEERTKNQRRQRRHEANEQARLKRQLMIGAKTDEDFVRELNQDDEARDYAAEEGLEPDGFAEHHTKINETTPYDMSNSEFWSSFSSSEEALLACDGLILNLPLTPHSLCQKENSQESRLKAAQRNAVTYRVPANGYYFFVFNSENEVQKNFINVRFDLQKTRYEVARSTLRECRNSTERCDMTLDIFSSQKVVLELPLRENDSLWNEQYVVISECEPRTSIYLTCVIAVPLIIMIFAFQ